MSVSSALASGGPIRRRRFILFATVLFGLLFFYGVPWSLPASLKDASYEVLSRASIARLAKSKSSPVVKVDEIFGLLHLVTGDMDYDLSTVADLDPSKPIDMAVYAGGDAKFDWGKQVRAFNQNYPVIVFSKVCQSYTALETH
jgi:hypothetical protein